MPAPSFVINSLAEDILRDIPEDQREVALEKLRNLIMSIKVPENMPKLELDELALMDGWTEELAEPATGAVVNMNMDVQENTDGTLHVSPYCDHFMPDYQTLMIQISTPPGDDECADMRQCLWDECKDVITISTASIREHLEKKHMLPYFNKRDLWKCCFKLTTTDKVCNRRMQWRLLPDHVFEAAGHYEADSS